MIDTHYLLGCSHLPGNWYLNSEGFCKRCAHPPMSKGGNHGWQCKRPNVCVCPNGVAVAPGTAECYTDGAIQCAECSFDYDLTHSQNETSLEWRHVCKVNPYKPGTQIDAWGPGWRGLGWCAQYTVDTVGLQRGKREWFHKGCDGLKQQREVRQKKFQT